MLGTEAILTRKSTEVNWEFSNRVLHISSLSLLLFANLRREIEEITYTSNVGIRFTNLQHIQTPFNNKIGDLLSHFPWISGFRPIPVLMVKAFTLVFLKLQILIILIFKILNQKCLTLVILFLIPSRNLTKKCNQQIFQQGNLTLTTFQLETKYIFLIFSYLLHYTSSLK